MQNKLISFHEVDEDNPDIILVPITEETQLVSVVTEEVKRDMSNLLNHPLYGTDFNSVYYPYNPFSKIKDITLFQDIQYTVEQHNFLVGFRNDFESYVGNLEQKERVLIGYAGTGKSTSTFPVVSYALQHRDKINNVIMLAPTNRAKLVVSNKLGADLGMLVTQSTIHGFLYGKPSKGDGDEEQVFVLKESKVTNSLICIDESSMITAPMLADLQRKTENCYILFIGDSYQLEPIGEASNVFDLNGWSLTEVKRNNSSILTLATLIRNHKRNFYFNEDTDDIKVMGQDDATMLFLRFFNPQDPLYNIDTIFVVATNDARLRFTAFVRSVMFDDEEMLHHKEKIIIVSNSSGLTNGEMIVINSFEILQDIEFESIVSYGKQEIITNYYGCLCIINDRPIVFLPDLESASLSVFKLNECNPKRLIKPEYYQHFLKEQPTSQFRAFQDYGREYFNLFNNEVNIATYGYSCSAHKLQGSEAENVFVFQNYCNDSWDSARWFYTAITRASKRLVIIPNARYQTPIPLDYQ